MKILEDSPTRLLIRSRRSLMSDVGSLFFILWGGFFSFGIASGEVSVLNVSFIAFGLGFLGIGVWSLAVNGATTAEFDADQQTLDIKSRRILGTKSLTIPLSDLADIDVHENDGSHTLEFTLANGKAQRFEDSFSGNESAHDVAKRARHWLSATRAAPGAT